jgi:predicted alpha/beta superfamily hydrolase
MKFIKSISFILAFICVISDINYSQNTDENIVAGKKIKIFSKILNEERPILISLPSNYEQSKNRYPVLYISDASERTLIVRGGLVRYFSYMQWPQMIIVYIPNTDRGRDYSISAQPLDQLPNSGGSGGVNFLKFLKEELLTYIDNNYRTSGYRIFSGESATAGYVFNTLITEPDCFDAYIAASPSVFFEKEMLDKTKAFFKSHKSLNKFLYVSYYERDLKTTTSIYPKIHRIISENHPKDFRYALKIVKGQAHVINTALFDGLLELFKGWHDIKVPEITPSNGLLSGDKSFKVELKGYDTTIRYTFDGSEPTRESILYTGPFFVSKPIILKAKSFRSNLCESEVITSEYKFGNEPVPVNSVKNIKPGLEYKYFEKRWFILPDSINLTPVKTGILKTFTIKPRTKNEGFLFQFDGYISITREGQYRFYLLSTADCKLFLNNNMIIDNPCNKATGDLLYDEEEYSYETFLKPGYYQVKILYTNAWYHGDRFIVSYSGPGIKKQEIPAGILFHKSK